MTNPKTPPTGARLLRTAEVAEILDVAERTMENWRYLKVGPPYIKVGGSVRYRASAIEAYLTAQTRP